MSEKEKVVFHERAQIADLLNGIYAMLFKNDQSELMGHITKLPLGLADPLLRTLLSYGDLTPAKTMTVIKETYDIYKRYIAIENNDEQWSALFHDCEDCIGRFSQDQSEAESYARRILIRFLAEIEYKCISKKKAA